jgi:hypothetical protein
VAVKKQPDQLGTGATASLTYVTGSESEDDAKGDPADGIVRVTAKVDRPELRQLQATLVNLLFAQLPDLVRDLVRPILGPPIDSLLAKITDLAAVQNTRTVPIGFHIPRPKTPTPEPTPTEEPKNAGRIAVVFDNQDSPVPVEIDLDAGTCDGTKWTGTVRLLFQVTDAAVASIDLDETRPIKWSFAKGDSTRAKCGPFKSTLTTISGPMDYSVVLVFTIARDAAAKNLTFTIEARVTLGPDSMNSEVSGSPMLGVPIPIEKGNDEC